MTPLLPPGWPRPTGYTNGFSVRGRLIVTAGVVGWDEHEYFVADNLPGQFTQVLRNIVAILAVDGARPEHLVRMTCYVTSIDAYFEGIGEIGAAWKEIIGHHYPAMALVEVVRLVDAQAMVEIEATAVVPE